MHTEQGGLEGNTIILYMPNSFGKLNVSKINKH